MGYRATRIEADRYRVSFRANPDLKAPQVEDMALRRAAEITLQNGYQWFLVVNRFTDLVGGYTPAAARASASADHPAPMARAWASASAFDLSPDSRRYESTLEILLGSGAKPASPDAYEARAILSLDES